MEFIVKSKILNLLQMNSDVYLSGEQISGQLGVSRTAVWKHINSLKNEGYVIDSVNNKGYKLLSDTDEINSSSLNSLCNEYDFIQFVKFLDTVDSTNSEAKRIAMDEHFLQGIVVANEQTKGKGRLGREWASEKNSGLWMSLLIRPKLKPEAVSSITLVAAAAMTSALEKCTALSIGIKWPNDLIINGKKICGILTEMSAEINQLHYIVLGIGVNLKQMYFPEELLDKATSLKKEGYELSNKQLLEEFMKSFSEYYAQFLTGNMTQIIKFHLTHSVTVGKNVQIVSPIETRTAYVMDINADGSLLVKNELGEDEVVFSGEVSVRGINGYI